MARVKKARPGCHWWKRKHIRRLTLGTVSGNKSESVFSLTSKSTWAGKGEGGNHLKVRTGLKVLVASMERGLGILVDNPWRVEALHNCAEKKTTDSQKVEQEQWEKPHGKCDSCCESRAHWEPEGWLPGLVGRRKGGQQVTVKSRLRKGVSVS